MYWKQIEIHTHTKWNNDIKLHGQCLPSIHLYCIKYSLDWKPMSSLSFYTAVLAIFIVSQQKKTLNRFACTRRSLLFNIPMDKPFIWDEKIKRLQSEFVPTHNNIKPCCKDYGYRSRNQMQFKVKFTLKHCQSFGSVFCDYALYVSPCPQSTWPLNLVSHLMSFASTAVPVYKMVMCKM